MVGTDYKNIRGGGLKLKGGKKNIFKTDKKKKHEKRNINEPKENIDVTSHGGWRMIENEFDLKGGINIAIECGSDGSSRSYLAAMDNGKFTIGGPHKEGEGPNPEEIFALVKTPDDQKISLKTGYSKYIGVDSEFQLTATADAIGVREQFLLIFQDGKCAIQSCASPLFLSTIPNKEGYIYVSSKKASEGEMICVRTDAEQEGPTDWRTEEDKKSAKDCETAYVKMYQHSKVDLKGRHISVDLNDKKSIKRAQAEGYAHELLLDRRQKTKSDRYC